MPCVVPVFVAFTGKVIEVECGKDTMVDEIRPTLGMLTGIQPEFQILTVGGEPVRGHASVVEVVGVDDFDGHGEDNGRQKEMFLYDRALLKRADQCIELPHEERLQVPEDIDKLMESIGEWNKGQTQDHLVECGLEYGVLERLVSLAVEWVEYSQGMLNESEVVAMAVDDGLSAVEPHYAFICDARENFQKSFQKHYERHEDVLSTFQDDIALLHEIHVHPGMRYDPVHDKSYRTLADSIDVHGLEKVAKDCHRAHQLFAQQVKGMEEDYSRLKEDVEQVFMRAPTVDLESLIQDVNLVKVGCDHAHMAIDRMKSHENGISAEDAHVVLKAAKMARDLAEKCATAKNRIIVDALEVLRTVSSQQSRIRAMKEAIGPFMDALARQDERIRSLSIARLLPLVFKQSLSECARRIAFTEKYSSFAAELAERMGKFREKEMSVRNQFYDQVKDIMPGNILRLMGLESPAPHCHVSVPQEHENQPLNVSIDYIKSIQVPKYCQSEYKREMKMRQADSATTVEKEHHAPSSMPKSDARLALENAKLRADMATYIAKDCAEAILGITIGDKTSAYASKSNQSSVSMTSSVQDDIQGTNKHVQAIEKLEAALRAKDDLISELLSRLDSSMGKSMVESVTTEQNQSMVESATTEQRQSVHAETSTAQSKSMGDSCPSINEQA